MSLDLSFTPLVVLPAALIAVSATRRTADDPNTSAEQETELLAVLRSDAPARRKRSPARNWRSTGSSEAVPDLAKLLPDPQLSSWARIALEAIPGAAADEALREASGDS